MNELAFTNQPFNTTKEDTLVTNKQMENKAVEKPIIKIRGLNVKTKEGEILKNINLDIPKNKIIVLLGPSGCGKTTLLKSLNRLTDLHKELKVSGEVFIDGVDILKASQELPVMRQKMGLFSATDVNI
ncbi:MAG: phosphate transport system ATP-binding [Prolixibacteraceae bacterium]|nr:MAG: phosphate transport system ATP-binding [Prolixibacteraceae bacterium]